MTGARRVPQCMGSWEYKVEWEGGTRAIWEMAETLAGTDTEVQHQMKAAKDGPEHGSMYERVEADREGLTKVLAGRASCEEDREDERGGETMGDAVQTSRGDGRGKRQETRGEETDREGRKVGGGRNQGRHVWTGCEKEMRGDMGWGNGDRMEGCRRGIRPSGGSFY